MKILFDGRWIGRSGLGRYSSELLSELQKLDIVNEYFVLLLTGQFETWKATNPNFHAVRTTYDTYTWQEQLLLPFQIRKLNPDLIHFTSFNMPILLRRRFVSTVHDLTLIKYKNVRGTGLKKILYEAKYWAMRAIMHKVVKRAQAIIVPTEYVKDGLVDRYGVSRDRVVVTLEALNPSLGEPSDISRFNLPETYLMYVGNYYPYKNIGALIEAFAATRACKQGVKLVLAGKADYFQQQIISKAEQMGLMDGVQFLGFVTDGELEALYQHATLYVFPSLCEGFGLPGLEAMSHGVPVLAANASCLPEVYDDAADYFDPTDISDMTKKIDVLLEDKKRQKELTTAGLKHAKSFSWAKMAHETLEVYNRIG